MKKILSILVILFIVSCQSNKEKNEHSESHDHSSHTEAKANTSKSPHTYTMATIGGAHIHIDYSSPRVRNRIVFGGLLAYDEVWQAGAHMATWVETSKELTILGQVLPQGKYGFFLIPSKDDEWTVIFNKNWNQHGKDDYDESEDVVRFKVAPEFSEDIKEELEYKIHKTNNSKGTFTLEWERAKVSFPFVVN
jgi:hypothetical protein